MENPQASSMNELSRIITEIQSTNIENIGQDAVLKAKLLGLSKKLTAELEDPVNRATDLVFKASWTHIYTRNTKSLSTRDTDCHHSHLHPLQHASQSISTFSVTFLRNPAPSIRKN
jgi:hypothetical protein